MNGEMKCILFSILGFSAALIIIVCTAMSAKTIEEGQQGVRFDDITATLYDKIYQPGLHWMLPDTEVFEYPTRFESIPLTMTCKTNDGVEIEIDNIYQTNFIANELPESFQDLGNKERNLAYLSLHARWALYLTCSKFLAVNFTESRGLVSFNMSNEVQDIMLPENGNTHTAMSQFQLRNFIYPQTFQDAVNSKQQTEQQIEIKLQEREQIITAATTDLIQAEQRVTIQLNDAEATRQRLLRQANETATTVQAQWQQKILALDAEKFNLGLNFSEFTDYKMNILVGDANGAVVSI
jgi:regulator of protease activity HflC (stomatin/prohibitin superfamily)